MLPYLWCEQLGEKYCASNKCIFNSTCGPCTDCKAYDTEWLVPLVPFSLVILSMFVFGIRSFGRDVHKEVWIVWILGLITLSSLCVCFYFIGPWISTLLINLLLGLPLIVFFLYNLRSRPNISYYHGGLVVVLLLVLGAETIFYAISLQHNYWKPLVWMYTTLTLMYGVWLDMRREGYSMFLLVSIVQYLIFIAISFSSEGNAQYLWLFPSCLFSMIPIVWDLFAEVIERPQLALGISGCLVVLGVCTIFFPEIWIWFSVWYFLTIGLLATHIFIMAWPNLRHILEYQSYTSFNY